MDEYISKTTAIEELEEEIGTIDKPDARDALINMGLKIALRDIKRLPAADVQPVKRGKWMLKKDAIFVSDECSLCKCSVSMLEAKFYKFCPYCGARMDGDAK